jgi:phage shock protein PspC (stress-responsive transcriptional regulator)
MKRLYRSRKDRVIAGVCGGIGDYFEIDPTLIRLIWLLLGLTGTGILAYIVAWVMIPEEPGSAPATAPL